MHGAVAARDERAARLASSRLRLARLRLRARHAALAQASLGDVRLQLSEHHGDACPGSSLRILVDDIDGYQRELAAKEYKYYRPGVEDPEWHTRELVVKDPFGNKLVFYVDVRRS
jgi:glyoxalase superfamily protein